MISSKIKDIKSFMVMDVMARCGELEREGRDIVHLEVGEPDFNTPEPVREAAIRAVSSGDTRYTHAMGMPELREAISESYYNEYKVEISPERILVTSGTSPGMLFMMLSIMESGDEIIMSDPHYACYPNFVEAVGGVPVKVGTRAEERFQYNVDSIKENLTDRTRGIIINSPSNPTGIVMSSKELEDAASFDNCYILSDEIYHGLVYEGRADTILNYTEKAFVVNGFSKLYAMTGWRLGYLIFPPDFKSVMERIHQNFMISANSFVQTAGIAALRHCSEDVEAMRKVYDERRCYMISRLRELGFIIHHNPTGAFYVFADASPFTNDTYQMAFDILEKAGVGVTPGIDFGSGGEGFIRFSYANSIENIKEGLNRIETYLKTKKY